jgi:hypothetical protein
VGATAASGQDRGGDQPGPTRFDHIADVVITGREAALARALVECESL